MMGPIFNQINKDDEMTRPFSFEWDFSDLTLMFNGIKENGILFSGAADLTDNGDGDFYVASIKLDGGTILRAGNVPSGHPTPFEGQLFQRLATAIENDEDAIFEWKIAYDERTEPDPDQARQERIDREIGERS